MKTEEAQTQPTNFQQPVQDSRRHERGSGWLTAVGHERKQASELLWRYRWSSEDDSPEQNDATHWCKPWMEGLSQSESNSFHTCSSEMHLRRWSCEGGIWHTSHCQQRLCRTQLDRLQSNRNRVLNSRDILVLTCDGCPGTYPYVDHSLQTFTV